MDCAGKLPEDQRNGTFLIRDSQSEVGSKVRSLHFLLGSNQRKVEHSLALITLLIVDEFKYVNIYICCLICTSVIPMAYLFPL